MKKNVLLFHLPVLALLLFFLSSCAPAREFHTASFAITGNCEQCEKLIEEAVNRKKEAEANWDPATKEVYIIFDSKKTTAEEVYKRIAYAGFDAPGFRAPDEVYASLPACCKYKRQHISSQAPTAHAGHEEHAIPEVRQAAEQTGHEGHTPTETKPEVTPANPPEKAHAHTGHNPAESKAPEPAKPAKPEKKADPHAGHNMPAAKPATPAKTAEKPAAKPAQTTKAAVSKQTETNLLQQVYAHYFALKDALVRDDSKTAAAKATELQKAITAVPMSRMSGPQHDVWMKHFKNLQTQAGQIAKAKNLAAQRSAFAALTPHLEPVMKAFPPDQPVYLQHCPMFNNNKGANWLSQEKAIRNPFYGKAMLSCGSTKETIR